MSINGIFLGLLMRKFDKVSARPSFSPKYCRAVAKNAIKPLIFMYHETMSIFLGSTSVLISVYFWVEYIFGFKMSVFQKHTVSDPLSLTNKSPPPLGLV